MVLERFCCGNSVCCKGLPASITTVSTNIIPTLVTQNHNNNGILNVYTIEEHPSNYRCRIPKLKQLGAVDVHGVCHGWMILSNEANNDEMWSLWNPDTSKLIRLPPLSLKDDSDIIESCCLSSPPGDPSSILLLTRSDKPNFVFCRLVKRKKSRSRLWTEMSYANQLKRIMPGEFEGGEKMLGLECLTCCNGKVYAISHDALFVVQIDIKVVKDKQVVITILPFQKYPNPYFHTLPDFFELKGCGTELFAIVGKFDAPAGVYVFKVDMTTTHDDDDDGDTTWEEINDLKDAVFFVDLFNTIQVFYIPAVASGFGGGYVHVRDDCNTKIHSFHVKDKTLSILSMPCLQQATHVTMWEDRGLEAGNDRQVKGTNDHKQEEEEEEEEEDKEENDDPIVVFTGGEESRLLDVPFHVLEMIMEHCVGIEYMNFRATCKRCYLAAPRIHWRSKTALRKLQNYSLVSPWLMVVEPVIGGRGIMNFTDPISGDKYLMKLRLPGVASLNYDEHNSISCSKYGWLLFYTRSSDLGNHHQLVFFNPFTNDVRKLPPTPHHYLKNLCFSAPPTSGTNCMVVGFSIRGHAAYILRYADQPEEHLRWHRFNVCGVGRTPYSPYDFPYQVGDLYETCFNFPTFHGRDLYALCYKGQLVVFKDMSEGSFSQPEVVSVEPPTCHEVFIPQYFLMERDRYLLLVIVDKFGGDPQLFQFNDSTKVWNQIASLERHVVFIGDATCVCVEAKTPKMQNKIYFQRFKDGKLIFYSLETSEYHTFDGKLVTREEALGFRSFPSTRHLSLQAWIEPTWY